MSTRAIIVPIRDIVTFEPVSLCGMAKEGEAIAHAMQSHAAYACYSRTVLLETNFAEGMVQNTQLDLLAWSSHT